MLIDTHAHVTDAYDNPEGRDMEAACLEAADFFGIDLMVSMVMTPKPATPERFRRANDRQIAAMDRHPDRFWGWVYVNPGYLREALAEIERCRQHPGFVGIKLFDDYAVSNPVTWPVLERCIELGWPILNNQSHLSAHLDFSPMYKTDAGHIAAAARRYPEAKLIADHVGGGGDWEWTCKTLADAPTVHLEISGSVMDEGMMELAMATVGAERLLFATDTSIANSIGKFRALPCTAEEREQIASGNFLRLVGRTMA